MKLLIKTIKTTVYLLLIKNYALSSLYDDDYDELQAIDKTILNDNLKNFNITLKLKNTQNTTTEETNGEKYQMALRQRYDVGFKGIERPCNRVMTQTIYMMRYRLKAVDPIRKEFRNHTDYKIAFLYGKIRQTWRDMYFTFKQIMKVMHEPSIEPIALSYYRHIVHLKVDFDYYYEIISDLHDLWMKENAEEKNK